jgi:hypothetical protein
LRYQRGIPETNSIRAKYFVHVSQRVDHRVPRSVLHREQNIHRHGVHGRGIARPVPPHPSERAGPCCGGGGEGVTIPVGFEDNPSGREAEQCAGEHARGGVTLHTTEGAFFLNLIAVYSWVAQKLYRSSMFSLVCYLSSPWRTDILSITLVVSLEL